MRSAIMPRLVVALILILITAAPAAADSPTLRLPTVWPPVDAERAELYLRCMNARQMPDLAELERLDGLLLAEHGDEDWALVSLARSLVARHGHAAARRMVADPDSLPANLAGLTPPALDVVRGVVAMLSDRYATAEASLRRALAVRPDWELCHAYLYMCCAPLLKPLAAAQVEADACADDAFALDALVQVLLWQLRYKVDDPVFAQVRQLCLAGPVNPLQAADRYYFDLVGDLRAAAPDARALGAVWQSHAERHGDLAWRYDDEVAGEIDRLLPTRESLPLLAEIGKSPRGTSFRIRQAWILALLYRCDEAQRILDTTVRPQTDPIGLRLLLTDQLGDAEAMHSLLWRAHAKTFSDQLTASMKGSAALVGDQEFWPAYWNEMAREYPACAVAHRLSVFDEQQVAERAAMLDSLESLGLIPDRFADDRRRVRMLQGAIPSLSDLLAIPDRNERADRLDDAFVCAETRGDQEAATSLLAARIEVAKGRAIELNRHYLEAGGRADRPNAERALSLLAEAAPGDPVVDLAQIGFVAQFENHADAIARLESVDYRKWTEPVELTHLAGMARWLKQEDLAMAINRRALELAPVAYAPRMQLADLLVDRLRHASADSLYQALAAEYPGSQAVAQKLMVGSSSVTSLAETPEQTWSLEQNFGPFGHDLEDVAAVRALAMAGAQADSLQSDVIILQERLSYVLMDRNGSATRRRRTLQVLSKAGVEQARTLVVGFTPDNGVPQLRVARVITPDGKVIDVKRDEILIRARSDSDADVTDSREMVIPFSGLVPGAIMDVAYDTGNSDHLAGGWSTVLTFGGGWPAREYLFEVLVPDGAKLNAVVANGPVPVTAVADPRIRAWRVVNPSTEEPEDWSPAYMDQLPWIGLTTYDDWAAVGREYGTSFWKTAIPDPAVRAKAEQLCRGLRTPEQKAEALYRFVAEEINPLAVELGAGRIIPTAPGQVLDRGWGDCKDSSALLLALLQSVGIEGRPVLVSTWDHVAPRRDLPALDVFDHVIVQITGIKGAPYCDPLNGTSCLSPVPASSVGRLGLHCDRSGAAELRLVTEATPAENGSDMTVDVIPVGERSLRYEINARYRGDLASYMRNLVASKDTSQVRRNLDTSVGYGLQASIPVRSWSFRDLDCGELEVRMAYVDTAWADAGATSAEMRIRNEGPVYWGLPTSTDRKADVVLRSPYSTRFVLRLHGSDTWMPSERVAEYTSDDTYCSGSTRVERRREKDAPALIVTQAFTLNRRAIPREDYEAFRNQAFAHYMFGARIYHYHRVIDEKLLDRVLDYAKEFPDDHAFRLKEAMGLLGTSFGGVDEMGLRRRALARTLLRPVMAGNLSPEVAIVAAVLECVDGHYVRGDSIVDATLASGTRSLLLMQTSYGLKHELQDLDGEIAALEGMINQFGSPELIEALIQSLIVADRPAEVERQRRRLEMMGAPMDSLKLHLTRFMAHQRREDVLAMDDELQALEPLLEATVLERLRLVRYQTAEQFAESVPIQEKLLANEPTDEGMCNDLAWSLAMLGRDLPRAEMLAQAACAMASDPDASLNTLGVVYARQGRWKEARDLFEQVYRSDDRPRTRLVNGYYLGLAAMELGDQEAGLRIWSEVEGLPGEKIWHARLAGGRELLARGEPPIKLAFAPPAAAE